jgi:O-antigen/teichoic acid export membrane protein
MGPSSTPEIPDASPNADDPAESIRRNALFGLGAKIAGAIFTGILTLYLVRALDPSGYGVFALTVSVGAVLILISDFGIGQATARFTAERRGKPGRLAAVVGDGLTLKIASSLIVSALLVALAVPIANAYGNEDLVWPLRLMAIALIGQSVTAFFLGIFEAVGKNSVGFRLAFSESSVEASVSIGIVALGAGVTGAIAGRAIGFVFGALLGFILARRLLRPAQIKISAQPQWGFRPIAGYAGALLIVDGAFALFMEIGTLMIGAILGTTAAGLFGAPMRALMMIQYPGLALAAGVAPRLARHPDHPPNADAFQTATRVLILFQLALVAPILVWAVPVIDLVLGPGYEESAAVLRLLAPFVVLAGVAPLLALSINYAGEAPRRIPIALACVATNALVNLVLINEIGIEGASIGADAGVLVYVAGHLWIASRMLGMRIAPLAWTTARGLLAAGAMCAVLYAFGTDAIAPLEAVAGLTLGVLTYVGTLLVTREVDTAELKGAWEQARGGLSELRPG